MKFELSLIVLCLLQLGIADDVQLGIVNDEIETNSLRASEPTDTGIASEESDRELRPMFYPGRNRHPGVSQKYGLDSLLGFRAWQNPRPVQNTRPQGLRGVLPRHRHGRGRGHRQQRLHGPVGPQAPRDINGDGQEDGVLIVGASQVSGGGRFIRIDPNTNAVFVDGPASPLNENGEYDWDAPLPTTPPAPTISPRPTETPTPQPTSQPTIKPTPRPTQNPTKKPTGSPTLPPTPAPTAQPTKSPTKAPTASPTKPPTFQPTKSPTKAPTKVPTKVPTKRPTLSPTKRPTVSPTKS